MALYFSVTATVEGTQSTYLQPKAVGDESDNRQVNWVGCTDAVHLTAQPQHWVPVKDGFPNCCPARMHSYLLTPILGRFEVGLPGQAWQKEEGGETWFPNLQDLQCHEKDSSKANLEIHTFLVFTLECHSLLDDSVPHYLYQ